MSSPPRTTVSRSGDQRASRMAYTCACLEMGGKGEGDVESRRGTQSLKADVRPSGVGILDEWRR